MIVAHELEKETGLSDRQEDEERKKLEREKTDENIVVENKVINVNNSSKEDTKSLFCWGTFVSDTGNIEKRTFLS